MVGTFVKLEVAKILPFGLILGEDEILLPKKYAPPHSQIGDQIEVFVYTDSEDRIIATTLKPYGSLGEIVALEIVDIVHNGAYLDLGIAKDIFMPYKNPYSLRRGGRKVVAIQKDKEGRLLANPYFKFLACRDKSKINQEFLALIVRKTSLGFECVVDGKYQGMLYSSEVFTPLQDAQQVTVRVKKVRLDGKLDLKLVQEDEAESLVKILRAHANTLSLTFDSDPQEIYRIAKMSKKAFKRAVSKLGERIQKSSEGITLLR